LAETTQPKVIRGATLTISDGTSGTPLTYSVILTEGSLDTTNAGYTKVDALDTNGSPYGPTRKGAQNGKSTGSLTSMMFGAGDHATDIALTDIAHQSGLFANWVTTVAGSDFVMVTIVFTMPATAGVAGATYTWTRCTIDEGSSVNWSRDGNKISLAWSSQNAFPTVDTVAP
jgi:hypothetical protein